MYVFRLSTDFTENFLVQKMYPFTSMEFYAVYTLGAFTTKSGKNTLIIFVVSVRPKVTIRERVTLIS